MHSIAHLDTQLDVGPYSRRLLYPPRHDRSGPRLCLPSTSHEHRGRHIASRSQSSNVSLHHQSVRQVHSLASQPTRHRRTCKILRSLERRKNGIHFQEHTVSKHGVWLLRVDPATPCHNPHGHGQNIPTTCGEWVRLTPTRPQTVRQPILLRTGVGRFPVREP